MAPKARKDSLETYRAKRDFGVTPEPQGAGSGGGAEPMFVVQKHAATRLHYDFRLEMDGVLKSWAVTRGPSLDPSDRRLAVRTEDHPIGYARFEGTIPKGQYGGGTVMLWDRGHWEPLDRDPGEALAKGHLKFRLHGMRLSGGFHLVRLRPKAKEKRENWLLIKSRDDAADAAARPLEEWDSSVATGRDLDEIAAGKTPPAEKRRRPRGAGGARTLPEFAAPQLATLVEAPPGGPDWLHEIKFDGYRVLAAVSGDKVRLYTRSGKDWTDRFCGLSGVLGRMGLPGALLDGEVVALDEAGQSRFGLLQERLTAGGTGLVYFAFDLLAEDGKDLRRRPLEERKARLAALLRDAPEEIRYSDHVTGDAVKIIGEACRMGLEGIVSKRRDSTYRGGRTKTWLKSKCIGRDEFVIGGFRASQAKGRSFSSLLLGEYADGRLVYRGRVGTGFDGDELEKLARRMMKLVRKDSPFAEAPAEARRQATWVKPELVAEIAYTERTGSGVLRQPSYLGLREDKPARQVLALGAGTAKTAGGSGEAGVTVAGVRLSNPQRVLFPAQGITKRQLAEYLAVVAGALLPHLAGRPLSLVRCPEGRRGQCFFQKHPGPGHPKALKTLQVEEKDGGTENYLYADDMAGIVSTAQIGALELHVWGARRDRLERPDRLVFDLDPDPAVSFAEVKRAATDLRDLLEAAGLRSFAMLTGGKGIHLVLPLERRHGWDEVKDFARGVAAALAQVAPERFVANMSKARRKDRIFIDYLRNERGSTAICPYSARAREGAPVAVPVAWDELDGIEAATAWSVETLPKRLASLKRDPWEGYSGTRQRLPKNALRKLAAAAGG